MNAIKCCLSFTIMFLSAAVLWADAPVKTGTGYEITMENLDSGGSPSAGYTNGSTSLIQSLGEPGGITGLSGGGYFIQAGYFGQDLIAPKKIDLNVSLDPQNGRLHLFWSAPGDDHDAETLLAGTRFFIATTTVLTDAQNEGFWYNKRNTNATEIVITTGPVAAGNNASHAITGLVEGVTYYFRIWTLDQACNWSEISSGATAYFLWSPGAITDLKAYQGLYGRSVKLVWTAPGDNGYTGTLPVGSRYAIQRSTWMGVTYSTYSADTVYVSTSNVDPGDYQTYNLGSLDQGVTYYVRMWTADKMPNWSSISNSSAAWATWTILSVTIQPATYYYFGQYATAASTDTNRPFVVENDGNVIEDYSLSTANTAKWSVSSTPGDNIFKLQTAFHATRPEISAYGAEDNLSNTPVIASNSVFSINGSHMGTGVDPFTNTTRNLWFKLSTPLATGTTTQQHMYFTVTAQEAQ